MITFSSKVNFLIGTFFLVIAFFGESWAQPCANTKELLLLPGKHVESKSNSIGGFVSDFSAANKTHAIKVLTKVKAIAINNFNLSGGQAQSNYNFLDKYFKFEINFIALCSISAFVCASIRKTGISSKCFPATKISSVAASASTLIMALMQLGEVVFGGVGSGLYGMLVFAILAVFIACLMIGRTPEYLGKKIEPFEMKMSAVAILVTPIVVLTGTAILVALRWQMNALSLPEEEDGVEEPIDAPEELPVLLVELRDAHRQRAGPLERHDRVLSGPVPKTYTLETLLSAGTYTISWFCDKFAHVDASSFGLALSTGAGAEAPRAAAASR